MKKNKKHDCNLDCVFFGKNFKKNNCQNSDDKKNFKTLKINKNETF